MKKIIIISGDPVSINSEIIYKSIKRLKKNIKKKIYLISNIKLMSSQLKKLKLKLNIQQVKNFNEKVEGDKIKLINVKLNFNKPFNIQKREASSFVHNCLNLAHKFANKENNIGIINCPINKDLFKKQKVGVTEYLSNKSNIKDNSEVMLISNGKFAVSPITTHVDIKEIHRKINKNKILKKVNTINNWFKKKFKKKPKIGVLGLNPHNAELRKNSEERKIIIPAIKILKKKGILIKGPMVADTIFIKDYKKFDVIVGMYHDQVLTPFKTIFKFDAINITLGLKYLRVSPDHGVAKDLICKNKANPESLINCINFLNNF